MESLERIVWEVNAALSISRNYHFLYHGMILEQQYPRIKGLEEKSMQSLI